MSNRDSYDCAEITVLEGLEAVRKRPGMYIGDVHDGSGLHHLIWEVVANSIDDHLAGHCSFIAVTLERDGGVTVEDDGRGIPVEPYRGRSTLEVVMTTLHAGATFDGHSRHVHVSARLHGVGLAAVNAVCECAVVSVARDGKLHRQTYARGTATSRVEVLGVTSKRGTHLRFVPDRTIFSRTELDGGAIRARIQDLSHLLPGVRFRFVDRRIDFSSRGIVDMAKAMKGTLRATPEDGVLHGRLAEGHVDAEIALFWAPDERRAALKGFVNLQPCIRGTHMAALGSAMTPLLRDVPPRRRPKLAATLSTWLCGTISILHFDPEFAGPIRERLVSKDVEPVVGRLAGEVVTRFVREQPETAMRLVADAVTESFPPEERVALSFC